MPASLGWMFTPDLDLNTPSGVQNCQQPTWKGKDDKDKVGSGYLQRIPIKFITNFISDIIWKFNMVLNFSKRYWFWSNLKNKSNKVNLIEFGNTQNKRPLPKTGNINQFASISFDVVQGNW